MSRIFNRNSDSSLIRRIAARDEFAARALVARKLQRIVSFTYQMMGELDEAGEIAKQVFVRVWHCADVFPARDVNVDIWMHSIALAICRSRIVVSCRSVDGASVATVALDESEQLLADLIPYRPILNRVRDALMGLPVRQREALILVHYQKLSLVEAAQVMSTGVEVIEELLLSARRLMEQQLLDPIFGRRCE
ncbi:RNA polymerase sigma-70 factor [Paraburkholderia sp. JHI869]|uniref:RNA polymerase sigma-70 factor n=1 Tax=Paraburkholderia sp. JHI869 TaxID=3112959 RepID=UPI00317BEEE9